MSPGQETNLPISYQKLSLRLNRSRKEQRTLYLSESSWWERSLASVGCHMSRKVRMPLISQFLRTKGEVPGLIHLLCHSISCLTKASPSGLNPCRSSHNWTLGGGKLVLRARYELRSWTPMRAAKEEATFGALLRRNLLIHCIDETLTLVGRSIKPRPPCTIGRVSVL